MVATIAAVPVTPIVVVLVVAMRCRQRKWHLHDLGIFILKFVGSEGIFCSHPVGAKATALSHSVVGRGRNILLFSLLCWVLISALFLAFSLVFFS